MAFKFTRMIEETFGLKNELGFTDERALCTSALNTHAPGTLVGAEGGVCREGATSSNFLIKFNDFSVPLVLYTYLVFPLCRLDIIS